MSRLVGKILLKINNIAPITMEGPWNMDRSVPNHYAYGPQGYLGVGVGTQEDCSGACQFVIPATGLEIQLYNLQVVPFTLTWLPGLMIDGQPALNNGSYSAIDCLLKSLKLQVDSPAGKTMLSGTLSAGMFNYPGKISA